MRFLVLGAGALGGFFGGMLIRSGADVTFLVRQARAAQLKRDGLVIVTQDGETLRMPANVVDKADPGGPYDVILLACKSYDLPGAIESISAAVGEQTAILPVLNGVRHIDTLADRFGVQRVLGGLTAINGVLKSDGTIQQGPLRLNMNIIGELDGSLSHRCQAIKSQFDAGGIPIQIHDNIRSMMWRKLFGFACGAAVATLTRSRAGSVVESACGASLISQVIEESSRIVAAAGYPESTPSALVRSLFVNPEYRPSMLVDMEEGRPTECEHTIGELVTQASRAGVPAPVLTAALCNLQVYEINRLRAN